MNFWLLAQEVAHTKKSILGLNGLILDTFDSMEVNVNHKQ